MGLGICHVLVATLSGGERLSMRVSPAVLVAPGSLTVSVIVETDAENRFLEVVAESPDFYRSSQIPMDGSNAPRLHVFHFTRLPIGLYQVTGKLIGAQGQRAVALRLVKVEPSAGSGQ